jgi:hypothetical protein
MQWLPCAAHLTALVGCSAVPSPGNAQSTLRHEPSLQRILQRCVPQIARAPTAALVLAVPVTPGLASAWRMHFRRSEAILAAHLSARWLLICEHATGPTTSAALRQRAPPSTQEDAAALQQRAPAARREVIDRRTCLSTALRHSAAKQSQLSCHS